MKTITHSALIHSLLNGAKLTAYSARTEPSLNVKTRATEETPSVPRPWDKVLKFARGAYLNAESYIDSVKRKLAEAGVDAEAWKPAPLPWGPDHVYVKGLEGFVSTYKGGFYLWVQYSEVQRDSFRLVTSYATDKGEALEFSKLLPFMSPSSGSKKQDDLGIPKEKQVHKECYKFASLQTVKLDGEEYQMEHSAPAPAVPVATFRPTPAMFAMRDLCNDLAAIRNEAPEETGSR